MKNTKTEECDNSESEKSLKNLLHELECGFKQHFELFQCNLDLQKNIIDSMWTLSQRFLILTRGAICARPYPQEQSYREERVIRAEFKIKKAKICKSNSKLTASLEALKPKCRAFDRALADIDVSVPSKVIDGNEKRQPIYFYIDLYADCMKFFQDLQCSLLGKILKVDDMKTILEYKDILESDTSERAVNYFEESMSANKN